MSPDATELLRRQLNLPPDTNETYVGFDDKGQPWLLRYGLPAAEDEWSALGFDERNYPCVVCPEEASRRADKLIRTITITSWVQLTDRLLPMACASPLKQTPSAS